MRLRRNSVRNHDVKKRDHLLAFGVEDGVEDEFMVGCSRSLLHLGRLRLQSGAMWMKQFNLSNDDKALENIAAVWGVAGAGAALVQPLRGMEGAVVMLHCTAAVTGQYLAVGGHHQVPHHSEWSHSPGGYYYYVNYTPVAAGTDDPFFLLFTDSVDKLNKFGIQMFFIVAYRYVLFCSVWIFYPVRVGLCTHTTLNASVAGFK